MRKHARPFRGKPGRQMKFGKFWTAIDAESAGHEMKEYVDRPVTWLSLLTMIAFLLPTGLNAWSVPSIDIRPMLQAERSRNRIRYWAIFAASK